MSEPSSVRPVRFPDAYGTPGGMGSLIPWSHVEERMRGGFEGEVPQYYSGSESPFRPFWTLRPTTAFAWTLAGFPRGATRWSF